MSEAPREVAGEVSGEVGELGPGRPRTRRREVWAKDRRQLLLSGLLLCLAGAFALLTEPAPTLAAAGDDPVPVLLVPGWSDGARQLGPLRARLLQAGWDSTQVVALDFEDSVGSNVDHAREIAAAAEGLRRVTGAERIDVVAHSMGGLATRYWLGRSEGVGVRRVVFIATPHRGTLLGWAAWGEGGAEMRPGSAFLLDLGGVRGVPQGIEALTVRSKTDMHIVPNSSATLPGVPDVELCCPGHAELLRDPQAFDAITRFLLRD